VEGKQRRTRFKGKKQAKLRRGTRIRDAWIRENGLRFTIIES